MIVTHQALERLEAHWAVTAIGEASRRHAMSAVRTRYLQEHIGQHIHLDSSENAGDAELLQKLAIAYEIAAIEGLDSLLYPSKNGRGEELQAQAMAGAYRAFEVTRSTAIPADQDRAPYSTYSTLRRSLIVAIDGPICAAG